MSINVGMVRYSNTRPVSSCSASFTSSTIGVRRSVSLTLGVSANTEPLPLLQTQLCAFYKVWRHTITSGLGRLPSTCQMGRLVWWPGGPLRLYNAIQCFSAHGRLCITMSVGITVMRKKQCDECTSEGWITVDIMKCSRETIPHIRTANRKCTLPEQSSCASYGGGSGSWRSELTSLHEYIYDCMTVAYFLGHTEVGLLLYIQPMKTRDRLLEFNRQQ